MKAYLKFLYLSIIKKISTWIIFIIYLLSIIFFVYILPTILNQSLQSIFAYVSIILLLVIIIATCSAYITATIFRSGIDDGTELLLLSKQITRLNIIWAKVFVLISIELIISALCSILVIFTKFFKFGISNPLPFVIGVFLMYFIVSLFFSSITIILSLKLKKSSLTIVSSSIAVLISLLSFINYIVAKTPGIFNTADSYSISQNALFKKNDNKNFELYDGYNLYFNGYPVTSETTNYDGNLIINNNNNDNVINNIYKQNLNKTNFLITSQIDIGFQWTQLLNLSNFVFDSQTVERTSSSPSSLFNSSVMSNYYLTFEQIEVQSNEYLSLNWKLDSSNINFFPISTREHFGIYKFSSTNKFKSLNNIDNNYYNLKSKFVYIPTLDIQDNIIKLIRFNNPYNNKSPEIIDYLINEVSIIKEYKEFLNFIKVNTSTKTYYFNQFLLSYYFYMYNILIENIHKNMDIQIIDKFGNELKVIKNANLKNIFHYDFHIDLEFYKIKPIDYLSSYNLVSLISIITFCMQNLESIQYSAIEYLSNINSNSGYINNNEDNSIISSIIFKNNSSQDNSIIFYGINNMINNNSNYYDYLNESSIYINEIPVSSSNIDNFSTFAIAKYNTYLNLYGTIFGWLGICIIFISISTYFYYKKDFK